MKAAGAHIRHHSRFYVGLAAGLGVWLAVNVDASLRFMVAGDAFYIIYLASTAVLLFGATSARLRERAAAAVDDEGVALIAVITLAAIALNLSSMFVFLSQPEGPDLLHAALSISGVPLGWLTLHTVMAFHYAHRYYARRGGPRGKAGDPGGLTFPGGDEPGAYDFLYFSFVVGMTAQVSDVQVTSSRMRRLTLAHGIVSFFYNTVILALAVNIAVGWSH